jgi:bifunctional non-homologous end joining protein LigD
MTLMRPMLATPGRHIPADDGWTHEVKWDGIRVLAESRDGLDRFLSRNGNDITRAWPDLAVSPFPGRDLLVDGEVIALNEEGLPDFRVLQERMHVRSASAVARLVKRVPATFMVFDLLRLDGTDLTSEPLERRRGLLVDLMEGAPWQVPTAYDDGPMLYEATRQQGLEGIVSKRLSSRYHFGERTPDWLKFAHRHRASYVVGGWRPQEGGTHLAALLVGEPSANGLLYRGRVGSGIGPKVSRQLTAALEGHGRTSSPFAQEVPRVDALGTHWVDPVLVVDVEAHRLPRAEADRLRQPAYKGIRPDLTVDEV